MSSSSSASDNDDEDDSSLSQGQPDVSESEKYYVAKGNDKRVLICLCIGLKDANGEPYIDPEKDPWSKQAAYVRKPKMAEHLKPEIMRRSASFGSRSAPRPGQWKLEKCMKWLNANPVQDSDCKDFLIRETLRVTRILEAAIQEKATEASAIRLGVWSGPKPYLRLVHCIIDDSIRSHYLRRDAVMTRSQLDSRNSEYCEPTPYERIANKWNDRSFNPMTIISACHHNFLSPINIGHGSVKHLCPAVASDVKDRLTDIRARLIRMIKKWERSGQGDGGRDDEEEYAVPDNKEDPDNLTSVALGKLEGCSQFAMDSRQNFLSNRKYGKLNPWYLFFWELADKFELLVSTVTELNSAVGAVDANAVPAAITTGGNASSSRKRKRTTPRRKRHGSRNEDDDEDDPSSVSSSRNAAKLTSALLTLRNETKLSRIGQHIGTLREDARSINGRIAELKRLIHQHQIDSMETKLHEKRVLYSAFITDYLSELNDLKSQLDDITTKVKEHEQKLEN